MKHTIISVAFAVMLTAKIQCGDPSPIQEDDATKTTDRTEQVISEPITEVVIKLTYTRSDGGKWTVSKVETEKSRYVRTILNGRQTKIVKRTLGPENITSIVVTNNAPTYPVEIVTGFVNTESGGSLRLQTTAPKGALDALKARLGE